MNTKSTITSEDDVVEVANEPYEICEVRSVSSESIIDLFDANTLLRWDRDNETVVSVASIRDGEFGKPSYEEGVTDALSILRNQRESYIEEGDYRFVIGKAEEEIAGLLPGEEEPERIPLPEDLLPEDELEAAKEFVENLHQLLSLSGAEIGDTSQREGMYFGRGYFDWLVTEASADKVVMVTLWSEKPGGQDREYEVSVIAEPGKRQYSTVISAKAEKAS